MQWDIKCKTDSVMQRRSKYIEDSQVVDFIVVRMFQVKEPAERREGR